MTSRRFAVVLAGGRGERFWPLSRAARPKQLMPLPGGGTLLSRTVERLSPLFDPRDILVVTSRDTADEVRDALPLVPPENVIDEPSGRNTAPAIALAALLLEWREPGCAFAALPADHHIPDPIALQRTLHAAFHAADPGALVTLGVKPRHPATGYGYIRRDGPGPVHRVAQFKEKPDAATAQRYLDAGDYYWNSGMFVWRAAAILDALRRHAPQVLGPVEALRPHLGKSSFPAALDAAYAALPSISIDYAVLERTDRAAVIEAPFEWDDIGAWDAFLARFPDAAAGVLVDSPGASAISSDPAHVVAVLGLPDILVVHTPDATLVVPKGRTEEVRRVVERLRADKKDSHL